jgi:hypothetical protein
MSTEQSHRRARVIGSRGSDLALWQSRTVLGALRAAAAMPAWQSDITVVTTSGDVDPSPYLAGGVQRGFFTKELEVALLERHIDLVVHSLKDLPTATPAGLLNQTILPRANPADWLLVRPEFYEEQHGGALPLRKGTRVGASSLRRAALLGHFARVVAHGAGAGCAGRAMPRGRERHRASRRAAGRSRLCRRDALGARVPARHRGRLLHALRLPRGRQPRPPRNRERARLARAHHRTTDRPDRGTPT